MSTSLMSSEVECFVCGRDIGLHRHHVFEGVARRSLSEVDGCWIWLCSRHHTGKPGVHRDKQLDIALKMECQRRWELSYGTREDFIRRYTHSYL